MRCSYNTNLGGFCGARFTVSKCTTFYTERTLKYASNYNLNQQGNTLANYLSEVKVLLNPKCVFLILEWGKINVPVYV